MGVLKSKEIGKFMHSSIAANKKRGLGLVGKFLSCLLVHASNWSTIGLQRSKVIRQRHHRKR